MQDTLEHRVVPSGADVTGQIPPLDATQLTVPPGQPGGLVPNTTDLAFANGQTILSNTTRQDIPGAGTGNVLNSSIVTIAVTNPSSTASQDVTFAAYDVPNNNFMSQTLKLSTTVTLGPGETQTLTLDLSQIPGANGQPKGVYQLDVFYGSTAPNKPANPPDVTQLFDGQLVVLNPDRVVPSRNS